MKALVWQVLWCLIYMRIEKEKVEETLPSIPLSPSKGEEKKSVDIEIKDLTSFNLLLSLSSASFSNTGI